MSGISCGTLNRRQEFNFVIQLKHMVYIPNKCYCIKKLNVASLWDTYLIDLYIVA